jgi:hypothetical protein
MKFLTESLGNENAPGAVEGQLRCHNGTLPWENPLVKPIVTAAMGIAGEVIQELELSKDGD